jgi:DNA invertase Pin-like site-specific DNA recombinase
VRKAGDRAAIYARYSSDLQDRRSIDDQVAAAQDYAQRKGLVVVGVFKDEATSGASMHNRPGIKALMRAATERSFDIVLTESLDRLSRSQADIATLYEVLKFLGVGIEALDDGGAVSAMHIGLKGTMNALFLENLRFKTLRGQTGRAKAGRIPGGRLYGYDVVKGEERGLRTINESEAEHVRRIFREYIAGVSPMAIVKALNAEGVPSPSGKKWNVSTLIGSPTRENGTLNNPLYAGRLVFKRQSFVKNPATGKRQARANAHEERVVTEVPELRIIDEETWQAAQALRASRSKVHPRHHRRPKHLLSRLLVCGVCGGPFIVKTTRDGVTYFACSVRTNRMGCENRKTARSDDIERRVVARLKRLLLDPRRIELAIESYRAEWKRLKAERARARSSTENELAKVEAAIARTLKAIHSLAGGDVEPLAQSIRDLEEQRKSLKTRLAVPKADVVDLHPHAARRCMEIVENLNQALAAGGPTAARAIDHVRSLITSIRINPTPGRQPVDLEIEGNLLGLIDPESARSPEPFAKIAVRV